MRTEQDQAWFGLRVKCEPQSSASPESGKYRERKSGD